MKEAKGKWQQNKRHDLEFSSAKQGITGTTGKI